MSSMDPRNMDRLGEKATILIKKIPEEEDLKRNWTDIACGALI